MSNPEKPHDARDEQSAEIRSLSLPEQSKEIRAHIQMVLEQAGIQQEVSELIRQMQGRKFPVETAQEDISAIVRMVNEARMDLWYEGKKVTIYCRISPRARHARLWVTTLGQRPAERVYDSIVFPALEMQPKPL